MATSDPNWGQSSEINCDTWWDLGQTDICIRIMLFYIPDGSLFIFAFLDSASEDESLFLDRKYQLFNSSLPKMRSCSRALLNTHVIWKHVLKAKGQRLYFKMLSVHLHPGRINDSPPGVQTPCRATLFPLAPSKELHKTECISTLLGTPERKNGPEAQAEKREKKGERSQRS